MKKEKYIITGMSCAACASKIEKSVSKIDGVKEVNVNLLTNSMLVSYEEPAKEKTIINSVKKIGYGASKNKNEDNKIEDNQIRNNLIRLILSLILLIPLFYFSMGFMFSWPIGYFSSNLLSLALFEMALAILIMLINYKFYVSGIKALFHLSPNMDTLVMLGSLTAFIYSFIMMFSLSNLAIEGKDLHMKMMNISFETAGMIPTFIMIGKSLEAISKGKTTSALKSLLEIAPKTANIIKEGEEITVPVEQVRINDIFIVRPGQIIPVDGEIIEGITSVDESSLTGESMPVDKNIGEEIKSGTTNINGSIICKATKVGEDTTINQIIALVEEASSSKAKISSIADKVSGIFVPTIILISIIVFTFWMIFGDNFILSHTDIMSTKTSYSLERAIAVLVISCPCALGLATPVAIMVSSGKGAKNGILFKSAISIEEAGKIKYLVLDKTGTITKGEPTVSDIYLLEASNEEELLKFAYSLEYNSEHPLSIAIKNKAKENNIIPYEIKEFSNILGKGIKANINSSLALGGNISLLEEYDIDTSKIKEQINKYSSEGKTPLLFSYQDKILGIIAVSDVIKPDSKEAITLIKGLGILPIMLTGDNEYSAKYIAKQVGIDIVRANLLPEEKSKVIDSLKSKGKVMMVGDGINDAISLLKADVGVGIAKGSDIALNSASIILMKSTLKDAYAAIRLSELTLLNIKENLFWAFFYNLLMIPIAAGVFSALGLYRLTPWMGSAAMAVSSIFVVLNSLRINCYNIYKPKHKNRKIIIPDILMQNKENKSMVEAKISGMMCMHCVDHVTSAISKAKGVKNVTVSLEKNNALIEGEFDKDEIIKLVDEAGYKIIF